MHYMSEVSAERNEFSGRAELEFCDRVVPRQLISKLVCLGGSSLQANTSGKGQRKGAADKSQEITQLIFVLPQRRHPFV